MFTADELAALQAIDESAMQDRCAIYRSVLTKDDTAGHTTVETTIGSNVPCRVRPTNREPQSKVIAESLGIVAVIEVVLPVNSGVENDDNLTITPFQAQNTARQMVVRYVIDSTYETGKVCICTDKS
jgi:hypothetical protein